jgi:hypothetical protein
MQENQMLDAIERRLARIRGKAYQIVSVTNEMMNTINAIKEGR